MAEAWKVYRLRWADGAVYIGYTGQSMTRRLGQHRHQSNNTRVSVRLSQGNMPRTRILGRYRTEDGAKKAESRLIREELSENPDCLNRRLDGEWVGTRYDGEMPSAVKYSKGRAPRRRERRDGHFTCSLCRRRLNAELFHSDRSRFNGLSSKCADCSLELIRLTRPSNGGMSWADAREVCKALFGK